MKVEIDSSIQYRLERLKYYKQLQEMHRVEQLRIQKINENRKIETQKAEKIRRGRISKNHIDVYV